MGWVLLWREFPAFELGLKSALTGLPYQLNSHLVHIYACIPVVIVYWRRHDYSLAAIDSCSVAPSGPCTAIRYGTAHKSMYGDDVRRGIDGSLWPSNCAVMVYCSWCGACGACGGGRSTEVDDIPRSEVMVDFHELHYILERLLLLDIHAIAYILFIVPIVHHAGRYLFPVNPGLGDSRREGWLRWTLTLHWVPCALMVPTVLACWGERSRDTGLSTGGDDKPWSRFWKGMVAGGKIIRLAFLHTAILCQIAAGL